MKKVLVTLLILGILGGGGYGAYYYYYRDQMETGERVSSDRADAVYVDQVSVITGYGSGNGLIERYGGEVEPQDILEVKLENDRAISKCYVKEGDSVKLGEKLFVYDTRDDEDKLAQDAIDIEKDEGDIELSQKSIEQAEKSKAKANEEDLLDISNTILTEQNNIKRAEYDIKTKQLEMEQLQETIDNATVTSEMAGVVQKITDPNNANAGSDTPYITIMADGDFRIKGSVNESNYLSGQLYEGMRLLVYSRVDANMIWTGTVSEVKTDSKEEEESAYSWMDTGSGSTNYNFYVELDDSEGLILGQHVYMEEDRGQLEQPDGLWLEFYYIMEEGGKSYVWAANSSNVLEKREIQLGEYDENIAKYQILGGLSPEDYIADPNGTVTEGAPVIYNDYTLPVMSDGDDVVDYEQDPFVEEWDDDFSDEDGDVAFYDLDNENFGIDAPVGVEYDVDDEMDYYDPDEESEEILEDGEVYVVDDEN